MYLPSHSSSSVRPEVKALGGAEPRILQYGACVSAHALGSVSKALWQKATAGSVGPYTPHRPLIFC